MALSAPHEFEQLPTTQAMPLSQTTPHAPQFRPSDAVSAQYAPPPSILQKVLPEAQDAAHAPLEHTLPVAHSLPHAPQFALSVATFAQNTPASPASLKHSA
jgi:hypothetical protein